MTPSLNIYQLEFIKEGKWNKRRSLFYRPEFIADAEIWQKIRTGNEVAEIETVEVDEEAEMIRKLRKKAEAKNKYR